MSEQDRIKDGNGASGANGDGQSAGGAYANQYSGTGGDKRAFEGGQSEQRYYGAGDCNAQSEQDGSETVRETPGISTDNKSDDTKS